MLNKIHLITLQSKINAKFSLSYYIVPLSFRTSSLSIFEVIIYSVRKLAVNLRLSDPVLKFIAAVGSGPVAELVSGISPGSPGGVQLPEVT
jgi:hypothetical protein